MQLGGLIIFWENCDFEQLETVIYQPWQHIDDSLLVKLYFHLLGKLTFWIFIITWSPQFSGGKYFMCSLKFDLILQDLRTSFFLLLALHHTFKICGLLKAIKLFLIQGNESFKFRSKRICAGRILHPWSCVFLCVSKALPL